MALPASARNTEQLQWVAAKVLEADGEAIVWAAQPTAKRDHRRLVESLEEARSSEYRQLLDEIDAEAQPTKRTVERWRRSWRAIDRRDYTDAPLREDARAAIADRAAKVSGAAKGSAT